ARELLLGIEDLERVERVAARQHAAEWQQKEHQRYAASTAHRVVSSALAALARERHQHLDALAQRRRRVLVGADERRPLAHGRGVARLPRREREQLACAVAERRAGGRDRLEPAG